MTHPLVPEVLALATPIADELGLEVVDTIFQTNQNPPVLRIDVRNPQAEDTSLEDCARMSVALEEVLDGSAIIPDAYVLEVSSPGVSEQLTSDRDFAVFKGFMVEVQLSDPHQGKHTWVGRLVRRDDKKLSLNQKGRAIAIPRELVQTVQLSNQVDE